jgi:hypothetical protein
MRQQDGAEVVVAANAPGRMTHAFLADDPAWALVFWSDPATVWVKRAAYPQLSSLSFTLDPRAIDTSVARAISSGHAQQVSVELARMLEASPQSVRALSALATEYHLLGDAVARDKVMQTLEALAPDHPAVRELARRFQRP